MIAGMNIGEIIYAVVGYDKSNLVITNKSKSIQHNSPGVLFKPT